MIRTAAVLTAVLLASPAWAQTQPRRQHFVYRCTILDGVGVTADGRLARNSDTEDYVRRQSPFTFDTETGAFQRAAGAAAGITETFRILSHGGMIDGLAAFDQTAGLGGVLHIRVDLPAAPDGHRFVFNVGSSSTFSGLCQRTPKP